MMSASITTTTSLRQTILADTGPIYAIRDVRDQYHERALADTRRIERERLDVLIATPILLEAYSLMLRRSSASVAQAWLRETSEESLLYPTEEIYTAAIQRLLRFGD